MSKKPRWRVCGDVIEEKERLIDFVLSSCTNNLVLSGALFAGLDRSASAALTCAPEYRALI